MRVGLRWLLLRRGGLRYDRARRGPSSPKGYDAAAFATIGLAEPKLAKRAKAGGARRDRTADLVIANDALSQLSYGPSAGRPIMKSGGQQSGPFTIRAKVKSRTAKNGRLPRRLPGSSLVCGEGNRYLAGVRPKPEFINHACRSRYRSHRSRSVYLAVD